MTPPYRIEPVAGTADLDGVQDVDRVSFSAPWTRGMYEDELRQAASSFLIVLRTDAAEVAGYCSYRIVFDELQISNVAVRPEQRGRGFGRALVEAALDHGRRAGARLALLEVRRSNKTAQRLYSSLGFAQTGERRGYYTHPEEDALVLARPVRNLGEDPVA